MSKFQESLHCLPVISGISKPCDCSNNVIIYIDITAALRAVFYIARVLACNIKYLHEGASPRRRYFRIARRAQRARVLYDNTALKCEDDIVYIHQRAFHQVDMEYI